MALSEDERLREEDPFTAETIHDLSNRIVFAPAKTSPASTTEPAP